MIEFYNFSKGQEDFFLIKLINSKKKGKEVINIIFDGGNSAVRCQKMIEEQINEPIDYIVVTHIDQDHMRGLLKLFVDGVGKNLKDKLKDTIIVYNKFIKSDISYNQAEKFEAQIEGCEVICSYRDYQYNSGKAIFLSVEQRLMYGTMEKDKPYITFLWPTKSEEIKNLYEGYKYYKEHKKNLSNNACIVNKSSIMCLIEYEEFCILMTGDGFLRDIKKPLKDLMDEQKIVCPICDEHNRLFKLPHHGSEENNSELDNILKMFPCDKFVLTNVEKTKQEQKVSVKVADSILKLSKVKDVYSENEYEGLKISKLDGEPIKLPFADK